MIIVSACLMGVNCKYNGKNNLNENLKEYLKNKEYMLVCPESLSGLGIPRDPVEIINGRVMTEKGRDCTEQFNYGIKTVMNNIEKSNFNDIEYAVLQSRSPSCGVNGIYDGSFSGKLIKGRGLFANELYKKGIKLIDIEEFDKKISK